MRFKDNNSDYSIWVAELKQPSWSLVGHINCGKMLIQDL